MTKGPILAVALAGAVFAACSGTSSSASSPLRMPELGPVPPVPTFAGEPMTPEKLQLGTFLYFDNRLSGSGKTNCGACHLGNTAFQDNLSGATPDRSYPSDSPILTRNTTSFYNIVYAPIFRWEGSHTDLVQVLSFPLAEANMNIAKFPSGDPREDVPASQQALLETLTKIPGYVALFRSAFGADITKVSKEELWVLVGRAFRALMVQAISRDAPFDRWNAGDDSAMDASAVRGLGLFRGKGRCTACHSGPMFTDFAFHNLSTSPPRADGTRADEGHYDITRKEADRGTFLTPTLRQAYDTSPYFHDGSKLGLFNVLVHLSSPAVLADPKHDPVFDTPLALSQDDMTDLVAFIKALRGPPVVFTPPATDAFPK